MEVTVIDITLVALTIALTQVIKNYIAERFIPLVPLAVAFLLTLIYYLAMKIPIDFSIVLEALKIAFVSMGIFKIGKTTVAGM